MHRDLIHFVNHMGEMFHEADKEFILVIPPPLYARLVFHNSLFDLMLLPPHLAVIVYKLHTEVYWQEDMQNESQ